MFKTSAIDGRITTDRSRRRSVRSADGSGFARYLDEAGATSTVANAAAPSQTVGIDGLLGLQEVAADPGERRRQARWRGEDVLDRLDRLRLDLLTGTVPLSRLTQLAQAVRDRRDTSGDQDLDDLLSEIELRAEVEIAKLSRNT